MNQVLLNKAMFPIFQLRCSKYCDWIPTLCVLLCFVLLQTILIHTIWVIWWVIDSIITPRKCINCQRIVSKENRALPMRHYCWDYSRVLVQGVRVHEDVKRCHQRVKCLELGDWLEVGLGTETGGFPGFPPWFSQNLRFNHQKVQRLVTRVWRNISNQWFPVECRGRLTSAEFLLLLVETAILHRLRIVRPPH